MRYYGGSQTDQGEILDNCCHVTSILGTLCSEIMLLQLPPSSDASSVKRGIVKGKFW